MSPAVYLSAASGKWGLIGGILKSQYAAPAIKACHPPHLDISPSLNIYMRPLAVVRLPEHRGIYHDTHPLRVFRCVLRPSPSLLMRFIPVCLVVCRCCGGQAALGSGQARHHGRGRGGEHEWVGSGFSHLLQSEQTAARYFQMYCLRLFPPSPPLFLPPLCPACFPVFRPLMCHQCELTSITHTVDACGGRKLIKSNADLTCVYRTMSRGRKGCLQPLCC